MYTHPGTGELRRRRWFVEVLDGRELRSSAEIDHTPALLGGASASLVPFSDDTVSRYHAELETFAEGVRIRDLDSTNGTFVQGERVRDAFLDDGDEIRLGQVRLRLRASDQAAASEIETDPRGVAPGAVERVGDALAVAGVSREILRLLRKIAPSSSAVLFEGDVGVGRATLAHTLHGLSTRRSGPFLTVSLRESSDPDELMTRIFGRGSRPAGNERPSIFENAKGGTLFLEDIELLPPVAQLAVLKAIDHGEIQRTGDERKIRIDVRFVASTTRDLAWEPSFSRALFRRLGVVRLRVPSVHERPEDVRALASHFASQLLATPEPLGPRTLDALANRALPKNFDELRALIAGLAPQERREPSKPSASFSLEHTALAENLRRAHVNDVVARHRGNVTLASAELTMSTLQLFRFLQRHDIDLDAL